MATIDTARAIGRLMPNAGGPLEAKRSLLASVGAKNWLYAALIWSSQALTFGVNRAVLIKVQRVAVIRISRCYYTVSAVAVLLLARIPPSNLLAR